MSLEEHVASLEGEVKHLTDRVGALTLEKTCLTERTDELEADMVGEITARGVLEKDIPWILHDGLYRIVDKVIESPHFLKGLVHVQATCMESGVEQGKGDLRELVVARKFDPKVEVDVATKTREMEDAIATFTDTDFVGYLHLGDIDLAGLCVLCQNTQSDESGPCPSSPSGDGAAPTHE